MPLQPVPEADRPLLRRDQCGGSEPRGGGAENLTWYRASETASRGFCRHCGSALFWKADELDYTSILAGAFEKPTELKGGYHIFCEDQGDFYQISDDLPKYAAGRG